MDDAGPFPGKLAGASLKRVDALVVSVHLPIFPRQTCRGLIEALQRHDAAGGVDKAFPGKLAGASLKLGSTLTSSPSSIAFPGKLAGASLKHRAAHGPQLCVDPFPGKLAGASLKPVRTMT